MKIMLLNDTSLSPHVGSLAVSSALERLIKSAEMDIIHRVYVTECQELWKGSEAESIAAVESSPIAAALDEVDAVVLNGEGTLHHNHGLHYLAILAVAQQQGLKTLLVNSILEEVTLFRHVISRLDECICRDPLSLAEALQVQPRARMCADLIVEAEPFWERECSIDLHDHVICTDWHPQRTSDVGVTMLAFHRAHPHSFFYPFKHGIQTAIWRSAKANIATAEAVIAARYHAVYLAILAGRPCVVLESNSHKMLALQRMLGSPLILCEHSRDLEPSLKKARSNANGFLELRAKLLGFPRFDGFSKLGHGEKHFFRGRPSQKSSARQPDVVVQYQSQARHWLLQTPEKVMLERDTAAALL